MTYSSLDYTKYKPYNPAPYDPGETLEQMLAGLEDCDDVIESADIIQFKAPTKATLSPQVESTLIPPVTVAPEVITALAAPVAVDGKKGIGCNDTLSDDLLKLNIIPPAFRPEISLPNKIPGRNYTEQHKAILQNRLRSEVFYLYYQMNFRRLIDGKFSDMFTSPDGLNMPLVERFIKQEWTMEARVTKVLKLTEYEQWQMSGLRSKEVRDKWRNAYNTVDTKIESKLRKKVASDRDYENQIPELKNLWLVDKIAEGESLSVRAQLFGWMTNTDPLETDEMSKRLKQMRRKTA